MTGSEDDGESHRGSPAVSLALRRNQMHLVQLLLPLADNDGNPFAKSRFDAVRAELLAKFGGVTAYVRSPAVGAWDSGEGDLCRDDVILFEVMVDQLDRTWWTSFKASLERDFNQEAILVRAIETQLF